MFNLIYNYFKDDHVPIKNGGTGVSRLFCDLKNLYFNFSHCTIDNLDETVSNIYPLELENLDFKNIISVIPNNFLDVLIKNNITILIYFPTEGFDLYDRNLWLHRILYEFKINGLANNPIVLIYGNLRIKEHFTKFNHDIEQKDYGELLDRRFFLPVNFFSEAYPNFKCFSIDYFERKYFNDHLEHVKKLKKIKKVIPSEKEVFNGSNKKVDFLSYNRHPRYHRLAFLYSLYQKKLAANCYLSFLGHDESLVCKIDRQAIEDASKLVDDHEEKVFGFVNSLPPRYVPYEEKDSHNLISFSVKEQFIDSWYSVVTETEISHDSIFLTEKTYKPILNLHPFIIWGNPSSLKYLRSIGYKTFPNMFDESYDLEKNPKLRLSMIISEILKFNKLSKEEKYQRLMLDRDSIIHNRKHFMLRSQYALQTQLKNIILDILPKIRKREKRLLTYVSK